jgi:hypothetical protein
MPIYLFRHEVPGGCPDPVELILGLREETPGCPQCQGRLVKVPSSFAHAKNPLALSNLKEKGFSVLKRRDKGAYEKL